jgi:glutathione S-transferase
MLTLYQLPESPFCDKIRRALNWKRIPYQVRDLSMWEVLTKLRRVNPIRKVPALDVDGKIVADSTDIAYYLDERWPERPLVPRDPVERALCHFLEDWADESLYFYEVRLRFTFSRNRARWLAVLLGGDRPLLRKVLAPAVTRVLREQCAAQGVGRKPEATVLRDVDRHLDALSAWLSGRTWLVGGALTLADLAVYAQLRCVDCAEEGRERIDARPLIREWMSRVVDATAEPAPGSSAPAPGRTSAA